MRPQPYFPRPHSSETQFKGHQYFIWMSILLATPVAYWICYKFSLHWLVGVMIAIVCIGLYFLLLRQVHRIILILNCLPVAFLVLALSGGLYKQSFGMSLFYSAIASAVFYAWQSTQLAKFNHYFKAYSELKKQENEDNLTTKFE